jgi:hypothetical protein
MDLLSVALLIVIVYLLINNRSYYSSQIERLEARITELQNFIKQNTISQSPERTTPTQVSHLDEVKRVEVPQKQPVPAPPAIERQKEIITDPIAGIRQPIRAINAPTPPRPVYQQPEPELSFFERYPDLEKFIGENLINKIGIAIE